MTTTATPAKTAKQEPMPLLPGIPAMGEPVDVPLTDLPPDTALHSDPPTAPFLDNVKNLGILQPIQLVRSSRGPFKYTVAAGRRRIKAARATGMESIPALVFPEGWVRPSLLAIAENEQRSANDLSDLMAIEEMRAEGFTDDQIRDAIGMSKQRFDSIIVLQRLLPELRQGMEAGKFIIGLGRAIATLPNEEQTKLLPSLRAGSLDYKGYKKVYDDYQAAKKATATGAVPGAAALPGMPAVPEPAPAAVAIAPSAPAPAAPPPPRWANTTLVWQERVKVLVTDEVRSLIPVGETDVLKLISELERMLELALQN